MHVEVYLCMSGYMYIGVCMHVCWDISVQVEVYVGMLCMCLLGYVCMLECVCVLVYMYVC